jgi:predicted methyltransferase
MHRPAVFAVILALSAAWAPGGLAQPSPAPASSFPKPDRPVANIVSPRWSDDADRDRVDESGQIASALGVKPGMALADIGAGSGYHTFRLSPLVGPSGRIYAEDVVGSYLDALEQDVRRRGLANVTVVRGTPDDPRLPAGKLDAAIMVHMYHEIQQPYALLHAIVPAFRPGGRLLIVDQEAPTASHGTPPALLRCELAAVGYRQLSFAHLKNDAAYVAVFEVPSLDARPQPAAIKACKG